METQPDYTQKFERIAPRTSLQRLPAAERDFVRAQAHRYRFTQQELRQLVDIALELNMWNEESIRDIWPREPESSQVAREQKKRLLASVRQRWEQLSASPNRYPVDFPKPVPGKLRIVAEHKARFGLGRCPVASPRTRCCNLMTLDAVESCGFDCSYCSIQSFYNEEQVHFDADFADKLAALEIDPDRLYHIGTGQSSDSLMWGNRHGLMDALVAFARRHPNVILELKTKSRNIGCLLEREIPANIICSWSLNTQTIVAHEEHLTASLEERLKAAGRVADRGILVGFHLHPMLHYDRWEEEYGDLCQRLLARFKPEQVAMVSLGTLTFTRSVIKRIRERDFKSKILRTPFDDADGKFSYPEALKQELFGHAYRQLEPWHDKVFFYLCMENQRLWKPLFGYQYDSNQSFEQAMKSSYMDKIRDLEKIKIQALLVQGSVLFDASMRLTLKGWRENLFQTDFSALRQGLDTTSMRPLARLE